eukprot:XP_001709161.1 Hypothetical protein GL50803_31870 [Giardia lamblia ATCC 50803]
MLGLAPKPPPNVVPPAEVDPEPKVPKVPKPVGLAPKLKPDVGAPAENAPACISNLIFPLYQNLKQKLKLQDEQEHLHEEIGRQDKLQGRRQ